MGVTIVYKPEACYSRIFLSLLQPEDKIEKLGETRARKGEVKRKTS